ncbi:hypothetical protein [Corynebacterium stationis]|uniref:hypothetical protein n=1 Tax=Corynebacterium stationis TaxID=1705 RepID=UPI000951E087|nr:hypothetical protein [Corynebacterium stationis]
MKTVSSSNALMRLKSRALIISGTTPDPIQSAVAYAPDSIVVAKNSGDSAFDEIDRLEQIVSVLVVD